MEANKRKLYWRKTVISFILVLFTMPLGHALMMIMGRNMEPGSVHVAAFLMGLAGWAIAIGGIFVKGDTKQTLFGLFGGLLFWTGWVEFLFQYYVDRYGMQPLTYPDGHTTQPEYLILPATFGLWAMMMTVYLFCTKSGCCFINWCQKVLFGRKKAQIAALPLTRHTSITTFMELNMMLWTSYLLTMFLYDPHFIGPHSPVTIAIAFGCLIGAVMIFVKELHVAAWGANIRMAVATVIVFWVWVEVMIRLNFMKEIWVEPEKYAPQMVAILLVFLVLLAYVGRVAWRKKK